MKNLFTLLSILAISVNLFAQTNMYIRKTDGSIISMPVTDIDSVFYINTVAEPVTDFDGNTYQTVQIGTQIWMAENLKTTHYANGDAISLITVDADWANLGDNNTDAAYCYYNNNASGEATTYGALYTWAAAMNGSVTESAQGICPTGWHLPSATEYTELTDFLGGIDVSGGKMKEVGTTHWSSPNEGATNESNFSGIGSAYRRYDNGLYAGIKTIAYFWTSTSASDTNAWTLKLSYLSATTSQMSLNKSLGATVRCVKN